MRMLSLLIFLVTRGTTFSSISYLTYVDTIPCVESRINNLLNVVSNKLELSMSMEISGKFMEVDKNCYN